MVLRFGDFFGPKPGNTYLRVRPFPWLLMGLAAPFNETVRELVKMKPLWHSPVRLDNARLVAALGSEPHSPLNEAVAMTLKDLGSVG